MDPQSFHAFSSRIGGATVGNDYVVGPMKGNIVPRQAVGYVTTGLSMGYAAAVLNTTASKAIINDVPLPFTAIEGDGAHSRWRLISAGVRLWNTSDEGTRGDSCQYVQPPTTVDTNFTEQKNFSVFSPNYNMTRKMDSDDGLEVVWIPRPQDLGYWHQEDSVSADDVPWNAGLRIFLTTNNNSAQVYRYQIVCHWEIAGSHLAQLQNATATAANSESIVQTAVTKVRALSSTGHGLGKMIEHVAGQSIGVISALAKDPRVQAMGKALLS
jgi:hypothetical protein